MILSAAETNVQDFASLYIVGPNSSCHALPHFLCVEHFLAHDVNVSVSLESQVNSDGHVERHYDHSPVQLRELVL